MYRKINFTYLLSPAWYFLTFPMDLVIMFYLLIKKKSIKQYWRMKSDVNEVRKVMEPFSDKDKNGRIDTMDVRYKMQENSIELKFKFQNIKITDRLIDNFRDGVRIQTGLNVTEIQSKRHWMYLTLFEAPIPQYRTAYTNGSVSVGTGINGLVMWNYDSSPHMLFIGETGTGKSTAIRYLLSSLLKAGLSIWCIDGKIVDYNIYQHHFERYVTNEDVEKVASMISDFYQDMQKRYVMMQTKQVDDYRKIDGMKPKFLLIDEHVSVITRIESELTKERAKTIKAMLGDVARKGRASGNQVIFSMQRPDVKFIDGEMRDNIQFRMVLGSASKESYLMAFGDGSLRGLNQGNAWYKQGLEMSVLSIPNYTEIRLDEVEKKSETM